MLRNNSAKFVFIWLSLIVFFPTYIGGMSLHTGQKFLYILYPLAAVTLIFFIGVKYKKISIDSVSLVLIAFFSLLLASALAKSTFLDVRLLMAHFRYLAYFLIYVGLYNYITRRPLPGTSFIKGVIFLALIILIFIIVQLLQPSLVEPLGISNRHGIDHLGFRIGGPMVWSYGLAFILIPIYSYILISIFICLKLRDALFFLVLVLTILGGQSKAAYLAITFCALILLFLSGFLVNTSRIVKINALFFTCLLLIGSFVFINLDSFGNIARFAETLSGSGVDASTQTRLNQLSHLEYTIENNIWLGYPKHYVVIENAYGYYFYNYGILGLLGYFLVMAFIFLRSWRLFFIFKKKYGDSPLTKLSAAALCFAFSAFVFSLANSPLDGHKTAYFYWSFFAIYFGICARMGILGIRF